MRKRPSCLPELAALAQEVGHFMQYWGFKAIHGRIWTHLYLSPRPLSATELKKRLGVSKALMSLSLHELLDYQVILPAGEGERGSQLFTANPEVINVILNVLRQREMKLLNRVLHHQRQLAAVSNPDRSQMVNCENLERLGRMIGQAKITLEHILALNDLELSPWQEFNQFPEASLTENSSART